MLTNYCDNNTDLQTAKTSIIQKNKASNRKYLTLEKTVSRKTPTVQKGSHSNATVSTSNVLANKL